MPVAIRLHFQAPHQFPYVCHQDEQKKLGKKTVRPTDTRSSSLYHTRVAAHTICFYVVARIDFCDYPTVSLRRTPGTKWLNPNPITLRYHTVMTSISFTLQVIRLKKRITSLMAMESTGWHDASFTVWGHILPKIIAIVRFLQTSAHPFYGSVVALHNAVSRWPVCASEGMAYTPGFAAFSHVLGGKCFSVVAQQLFGWAKF